MSYIGNNLQVAYPSYRIIDDISSGFNGVLKTFALTVAGSTPIPFPINPQQCLLSVNNIVQKPDSTGASGFTLTGSNIVFATAPTAGWSFFGTVLAGADYVNVGANFPSGTAAVPSVTFNESTGTGLFLASSNVLGITTGGVQRLVVNSSGFVGIGTTSPARKLDISNGGIRLNDGYPIEWGGAGNYIVGNTTSNFLVFSSGGNERVRINSSGNVGIGTSSPTEKLEVAGGIRASGSLLTGSANSIGIDYETNARIISYGANTSTQGAFVFLGANSNASTALERFRIDSSGNVGIGTTSPSTTLDVAGSVKTSSDIGVTYQPTAGNIAAIRLGPVSNQAAIGYNNDGNLDICPRSSYSVVFKANEGGTERARIDSSGRLLVGTSTARSLFFTGGASALTQIEGNSTGTASLSITRNDATADGNALILAKARSTTYAVLQYVNGTTSDDRIGRISFQGADGTNMVPAASIEAFVDGTPGANDMPGRLVFSTTADGAASPTERMRIGSSGEIMVGTTSITGNAFASGNTFGLVLNPNNGQLLNCSDNAPAAYFNRTASDGAILVFNRNGTEVGRIQVTTTATSYITSSDYRLKENVSAVNDGIARLQQLKPSRFNFIADPDKAVDGFIAHEAQAVVPECVTGDKDAVDNDGNPVYQGIDQSKLVPLLTAALQEAIGRIESLEAEVAALKAA